MSLGYEPFVARKFPESELARRTEIKIKFDGLDITDEIQPYLKSISYTDSEEDESDDLQITLLDRPGVWLTSWLEDAIQATAASKLSVSATITPIGYGSSMPTLPSGKMEIDDVTYTMPPAEIKLSASSLPYSSAIRETKKSKDWENYYLSGIARQIAAEAGLQLMYESSYDPHYEKAEQSKETDISFLKDLCHDAGISLKCSDGKIILFDQADYDAKPPILTLVRGQGLYYNIDMRAGSAGTQYSRCRVSYMNPATGKLIEGIYDADGEDSDSEQVLQITAPVKTKAEAIGLAQKWLRMYNKFERTVAVNMAYGDTRLVAGCTVQLADFGGFSGKYAIKQATHSVDDSGYRTSLDLRRVMPY